MTKSTRPLLTPNQITVFRFLLIFPLFIGWFLTQDETIRIGIALAFAAVFVGDCWDGIIAKRYNMCSVFGAYFDPIVDHISYFALCIMLIEAGHLSLWFLFVLLTRDLLVVFIKQFAGASNVVVSASIFAKVKTDLISVPLAGVYLMAVVPEPWQMAVLLGLAAYLLTLPVFFNPSREHTLTTRITVLVLALLFWLRPEQTPLADYYEMLYMGLALLLAVGSGIGYLWSSRDLLFQKHTES
jgi:CDP-diacylglycerol--glycerol-3-phosphate 3-phosphatidyltransferase